MTLGSRGRPDIAIFASGSGSNFAALADAFAGRVGLLISNEPEASVLLRAAERAVPSLVIPHKHFSSRLAHEQAILRGLQGTFGARELKVICLAGYMRVLSAEGLEVLHRAFPQLNILNLHPAHPSDYRGAHAYDYAIAHRFSHWGLTVHRVTAELDMGPVVATSEHVVYPWEDASALRQRLRPHEHSLFISAVRKETA